jgi:hypothetical protein
MLCFILGSLTSSASQLLRRCAVTSSGFPLIILRGLLFTLLSFELCWRSSRHEFTLVWNSILAATTLFAEPAKQSIERRSWEKEESPK